MDIQKALNELYEEKKRLDWTIATLEARLKNSPTSARSRRGRKNMGGDERLEVSRRMSAYWADRRAARRVAQAVSGVPPAMELDAPPQLELPRQEHPLAAAAAAIAPQAAYAQQPALVSQAVSQAIEKPGPGSQGSSKQLEDERLTA